MVQHWVALVNKINVFCEYRAGSIHWSAMGDGRAGFRSGKKKSEMGQTQAQWRPTMEPNFTTFF